MLKCRVQEFRKCGRCHAQRPVVDFEDRADCRRCRERNRARYKKRTVDGICVKCRKPFVGTLTSCAACAEKYNAMQYARKKPGHCRGCNSPDVIPGRKRCAACTAYEAARRALYPLKMLVREARYRAKRGGLPYDDFTADDLEIPELCPVLGIPLSFAVGHVSDNSPSIDRIVPERGYVRGNICIISYRANTIKNSGSAEEHEAIAAYIRRLTSLRCA